jgi:hypothetical protein
LPLAPRFPLNSNSPRETAVRDGSASIATSARIMGRHVLAVLHRLFRIPTYKDSERLHRERMLAPPAGSQPLPGWARGPLSVPLGLGTPAYKHQVKTTAPASRLGVAPGLARVPAAPAPASRLRAALGPPHAPMALAPASRLGAAPGRPRAPAALAPASRPGAAPRPPRVTWAPAPTICLVAPPKLPRDLWTGSAGRKEINKYPLATQPS